MIRIRTTMERYDLEKYGPHMAEPKGYIACVGRCEYNHRFGGASWDIVDNEQLDYRPTLILTLDLRDPRLRSIADSGLDELPLCAYLNYISMRQQTYWIDIVNEQLVLIDRSVTEPIEMLKPEYQIPNPIPEKKLSLRDMVPQEYPTDEDNYWSACDAFLCGDGVIRVLGPTLWLQWVEEETCSCGRLMECVVCVGYEGEGEKQQLMDTEPFFPGEMGFYFYLCKACRKLLVSDQST